MTKKQFKEAIRRGLGSAIVELVNTEAVEQYKEIVLWACLNNTCYDTQSEGGRGAYLYKAIKVYADTEYFEKKVIDKYSRHVKGTWLQEQLTELLYHFAKDGSLEARKVLYKKYDKLFKRLANDNGKGNIYDDRATFEWLTVWMTSLDGFKAFKKIVRQIGEFYYKTGDNNNFSTDWFYENAKSKFGKKRVAAFMQREAVKFPEVQAFLDVQKQWEEEPIKQGTQQAILEDFIEACYDTASMRRRGALRQFIRNATKEELENLAYKVIEETRIEVKRNLLECFTKVRFPLEEEYLWEMLENEELRDVILEALRYFPSDRVHDFILAELKQNRGNVDIILLLCKCYRNEDEDILNQSVKSVKVSYEDGSWHTIFGEVEQLIKNNSKVSSKLLMYMYNQTLCSYCRGEIVRTMHKRKVLTRELLEECLYDSHEDIQKYAKRQLKTYN